MKPKKKPNNPCFSSGPCSKRPGWTSDVLKDVQLGRSHRAAESLAVLKEVIEKTKKLLDVPQGYRVGIFGGSDTGAFELAMWNFLGARGVDVMYQEHFGKVWNTDAVSQLKLDVRTFAADFGKVPDTSQLSPERDLVFTLNGTTSGMCFHNLDFISADRKGITLCDATSIVYSIPIDFTKLDVTTYSWQKSLGGEAQHGIVIISPRAVEKLKEHTPLWPIPKLFQIAKNRELIEEIFEGSTINTPSMMCVYDCLDSLNWAFSIGGKEALFQRVQKNYKVIGKFIEETPWLENLCADEEFRSPTSVCFTISTPEFQAKTEEQQRAIIKKIVGMISAENAGFDFANHKAAPPSFRVWCGPTIEADDISALCEWIKYAYNECK
jgi:phosphoserine aminotransferase